jgi:hypothetical protein
LRLTGICFRGFQRAVAWAQGPINSTPFAQAAAVRCDGVEPVTAASRVSRRLSRKTPPRVASSPPSGPWGLLHVGGSRAGLAGVSMTRGRTASTAAPASSASLVSKEVSDVDPLMCPRRSDARIVACGLSSPRSLHRATSSPDPLRLPVPHGDVGVGASADVRVLARGADLLRQRVIELTMGDDQVRGVPGELSSPSRGSAR